MQSLRLGSAGMRGEIGSALTPTLVINFASAFGTYVEGGKVVIGRDSRSSSPMLHIAVTSALQSCGCKIIDAGLCSAPFLQFLVTHLKADGGLLIGAGHHPAEWNAIVPIGENGAYLNNRRMQELLDVYHNGHFRNCVWNKIGKLEPLPEKAYDKYLDKICGLIDTNLISARKFKVIADFCGGSGSCLAKGFAERLGIELIPLNDTPTGILPHDPEPRPRSSFQVKSFMSHLKADIGFVFNSDMSRTAITTDTGETLSEEYTFPLVASHILLKSKEPCIVVTNWCTTRTLDDVVAKCNGKVEKTKVGQAPIIDDMIELDAKLAGDGSGSVALKDSVPAFDSYLTMGIILESMAVRNARSSELAASIPRYHIIKRKVNCHSSHAYTLLRNLKSQFPGAKLTEHDGFRFDWHDGWVHLRSAMTEPIIRMIVEWRTKEEAEEKALQVRSLLERLVG
ncbi:MAG TPA: hypothetical protein DCZ94_21170 [Lentisphaeria bacterium]|nr:hypothetical protein [Lentisphaeria bacterium]